MFCRLKCGVMLLNIASLPLFLVSAIMDQWIIVPSIPANVGLLRTCNPYGCYFLSGASNSAFWLLMSALLLGTVGGLVCGILEVHYSRNGRLGCLRCLAGIQFADGLLGFAGMIAGTVTLRAFIEDYAFYYSWAYALGWLAVICALAAGGLSVYIDIIEHRDPTPETESSMTPGQWQPKAPAWGPHITAWQPQAPAWPQQQQDPQMQSQPGTTQPQQFTWQPNQVVIATQQTTWQPAQQTAWRPPESQQNTFQSLQQIELLQSQQQHALCQPLPPEQTALQAIQSEQIVQHGDLLLDQASNRHETVENEEQRPAA
ncbi:nuclear transcription factor Y subunit beta-like [Ambystoma mexicanum]|uniref:nuclear transcription factor Y subunit beta-like n=1 Tax=Ambystoma mexicanum TaxID=8296 RepID=UPI0037E8F492